MYEQCDKCGAGLTIIKACIACREQEGFQAYRDGKSLKDNPYKDDDARAWNSGWHEGEYDATLEIA